MKKLFTFFLVVFFGFKTGAQSFILTSQLDFGTCIAGSGANLGTKKAYIDASLANFYTYSFQLDKTNLPSYITVSGGGNVSAGERIEFSITCTAPSQAGTYNIKIPYLGTHTDNTGTYTDNFGDLTVKIIATPATIPVPQNPTNLSVSNIKTTSCNLSWSIPQGTITGYNIYQNGIFLQTTTSTTANINNLTLNTTYTYYVTAYNATGESSASNLVSFKTPIIDAPTNLTVIKVNCLGAQLSWEAPTSGNVSGYHVYDQFNGYTPLITTTNTTVIAPKVGKNFNYYVRAFNSNGVGANSNHVFGSNPYPSCAFRIQSENLEATNDKLLDNSINIYPNPTASDQLIIEGAKSFDAEIIDISGKMILKIKDIENTINISGIKPGNYVIKFKSQGSIYEKKFIKQ